MKGAEVFLGASEPVASLPDERVVPASRTGLHLVVAPTKTPSMSLDRGLWLLGGAVRRGIGWQYLDADHTGDFVARRQISHSYVLCKRIIDLVAASFLLVLLLPVFLLTATLIALDSSGPILFRQQRIGKDGKRFVLWKFRSMYVNAPKYAPSPIIDADPRLTPVGRLIRRISVDELPQLINVLKGEMSLVGPRPEMPFIVARYTATERLRLSVKPGITGLWQISSGRAHPIHENLQYDAHYIRHQNPLLDTAILLRTIMVVLRGANAV